MKPAAFFQWKTHQLILDKDNGAGSGCLCSSSTLSQTLDKDLTFYQWQVQLLTLPVG
jgi:hypothetical protein